MVVDRLLAADTLRPGAVIVIEGSGFATGPFDNVVRLGTAQAAVVVATANRLEVRLPSASAFPCLTTGVHQLSITSANRTALRPVTVSIARRVALEPGQSLNLLESSSTWCTELVVPSGEAARYTLAVINTSQNPASTSSFQVRAESHGAAAPALSSMVGTAGGAFTSGAYTPAAAARAADAQLDAVLADDQTHSAHLERETQRMARVRPASQAWRETNEARRRDSELAMSRTMSRTMSGAMSGAMAGELTGALAGPMVTTQT